MDFIDFETKTRASKIDIIIGDCLEESKNLGMFDAIICDPPYEISYMSKKWDDTGIAFRSDTWSQLATVLKPGGYLLAFSCARLYHHLAVAAEKGGFETHPFLIWQYPSGLPKPMNVSNLFDRDNCPDRKPIGSKSGSGYTKSLVEHGAQNYSKLTFSQYEKNVSDDAKQWAGFYYGVNTMKPAFDPIYMGKKPVDQPRTIDNIRVHRTGALNIGSLREHRGDGAYPSTVFECPKIKNHGTGHPTVKPTSLMEELILLCCPAGGRVLDPFAGTGSTGIACRNLGFDACLIDVDPTMREIMQKRIFPDEK